MKRDSMLAVLWTVPHTPTPCRSGFPITERVSLEHAFGPSFSLLLHPGWAPPVLPHAMPVTSAAGTVPAVGVASDTAPKMTREREGR